MKKMAFLLLFLTACSQEAVSENEISVDVESGEELSFIADEGIRMSYASNPGARVTEEGVELLYESNFGEKKGGNGQFVAFSEDGLEFEDEGEKVGFEEAGAFRSKQLPDGTWISYGYDTTKGIEGSCLTSQSSEDGIEFEEDKGCRYTLQEDDNGTMGVYDFFSDSKGNVVLLYLGDMLGMNNVRRAYSTDGGQTFEFTNGNVLGDEDDGGGARSYVDEKVIVMPNGNIFLVAMKSGKIYAFESRDDGLTFEPYEEALLSPEQFVDEEFGEASSLHDPQIVQLEDGTYRIYVCALFALGNKDKSDDIFTIVSATSL